MADEHAGGGGGEAKFFIGIIVGLLLIWLFGLYRSGALFEEGPQATTTPQIIEEPVVIETPPKNRANVIDAQPTPTRSPSRPPSKSAVTYYLDQSGNILEIVEY